MEIQQFSIAEAYYETAIKLDPHLELALSDTLDKVKILKRHLSCEPSTINEFSEDSLGILKEFFIAV